MHMCMHTYVHVVIVKSMWFVACAKRKGTPCLLTCGCALCFANRASVARGVWEVGCGEVASRGQRHLSVLREERTDL